MKRGLAIGLAIVVLLPALCYAGFRLWLAAQPNEFRASVEAFSTLEFLEVVADHVLERPVEDQAGWGRRPYPGRGHSPWVIRSSLDGRPRMISIAIAPKLWLAYSTETASIHQFWRGEIDFTGPVYDARHGAEPTSRGDAYLQPPTATAWRIRAGDAWESPSIRWRGHGIDPKTGALWLRYALATADGTARVVTEWPEIVAPRADSPAHGAPPAEPPSKDSEPSAQTPAAALERRFEFGPGPALALTVERATGQIEIDNSAAWEEGRVLFVEAEGETQSRLVQRFDQPRRPIELAEASEDATDPFAAHDCHTCHNMRERVVGPAFSEIALRHGDANRAIAIRQLGDRIRAGSVGLWGDVAMAPHPEIERAEAERLARHILETEPAEAPAPRVEDGGAVATWTFRSDTEEPPARLHPALRSVPLDGPEFTPRVGGLAWLPDGRLAVATWDQDGAVFAIDGWQGAPERVAAVRIAEGLHEPLGLAVLGDALYVMQKQEITQLVDHDGDDWIDEYRAIANAWRVTSNFHEFGFGLVAREGQLYGALSVCVLNGGKSCREQTPDRGRVFRVDPETGDVEFVASGFRTPNGIAPGDAGRLLVTDNQGDWLPASKLIVLDPDAAIRPDYGWRAPNDLRGQDEVTPPALWLPQNEVGNSPTQPLFLESGPYAGQILFGDIFNGGLKRAVLEEVEGRIQGAAFHFSGGLEGPVNRLLATPSGDGFVVGQIGSRGNWGEREKDPFGLEVVHFESEPAFEPMRVTARPEGFAIEFTRPLASDFEPNASHFALRDWYYVPSPIYGGPKYDLRELEVRRVWLSQDRRTVSIEVGDLRPGRVVYLHLDRAMRSNRGETLWVNEAWYTLSAIPRRNRRVETGDALRGAPPSVSADGPAVSAPPTPPLPNTLTAAEQAAGWRLLFDGRSFDGWKIYGAEDDAILYWEIQDGALAFTRDVSFAGLIWNHLNPFAMSAADLMTRDRFGDFELSIDWKISPGGNSGIFYLVPDESQSLAWDLGLEMQILDDAEHPDGQIDLHRAGDLYDLQSLARDAAKAPGEWNTARIRVSGDRIEHWLNQKKIVDLVRGGPEWNRAIAASKFRDTQGFGLAKRGHITLQDHGDPVWFRNIKLRELADIESQ